MQNLRTHRITNERPLKFLVFCTHRDGAVGAVGVLLLLFNTTRMLSGPPSGVLLLLFNTTRKAPDPSTRASTCIAMDGGVLLLFNTTRTTSGPPSTGAAIAMDGGVADTTCFYTGRFSAAWGEAQPPPLE